MALMLWLDGMMMMMMVTMSTATDAMNACDVTPCRRTAHRQDRATAVIARCGAACDLLK
jgi:hypothetical protein